MRFCNIDGRWEEANVLQCTSVEFIGLEQLVSFNQAVMLTFVLDMMDSYINRLRPQLLHLTQRSK